MKGIAHFISGAAAATFLPWTLQAAYEGNPWYFVLGGAFGILPDTLDFKFYRFFYKHDIYIEPHPDTADPQEIADTIADGIAQSITADHMIRIKLSTIRKGADYWQQYKVRFDAENQEVTVQFGPVVNTGQVPVPGTEPEKPRIGKAKLACPLHVTYDATANVDIFDGPTFGFEKDNQGGTVLHFLPWHREWTHALTTGAFFAVLAFPILFPLLKWQSWKASLVIMAAYAVHVLEDQLGFMGSNLFFPITKKRAQGLHIMRSGDSFPNFGAVWLSCVLIFWNMYRYNLAVSVQFNFFQLLFWMAILPVGAFWLILKFFSRGQKDADDNTIDADEWEETTSV